MAVLKFTTQDGFPPLFQVDNNEERFVRDDPRILINSTTSFSLFGNFYNTGSTTVLIDGVQATGTAKQICTEINALFPKANSGSGGSGDGVTLPIPRITTTERDAIVSPEEGDEIYNLTTHSKNVYDGTGWRRLSFASSLLSGTAFGSPFFGNDPTYSYDKINDGVTSVDNFYSAESASTDLYVGVDLGASHVLTVVRVWPRAEWAGRLLDAKIQASNTSSTSGYTDLATITVPPTYGQYTDFYVEGSYRYVRIFRAYNGSNSTDLDLTELKIIGD